MSKKYTRTGYMRLRLGGLFRRRLVLQVQEEVSDTCVTSTSRQFRWRDATLDDADALLGGALRFWRVWQEPAKG